MALADRIVGRFKLAGATDFSVFIKNPDVKAAFAEAVSEARYESGSGGYSGTIAEKPGYEIRRREPMDLAQANRFADTDSEKNDKHEPAFAIPVGEATATKEKKVKIKAAGRDEWAARQEAEKKLREQYMAPGLSVNIKFDKATLVKEGKLPEMTIEKGGDETYRVIGPGTTGKPFPSRAEAIAGFKTHVLQHKPQVGAVYEIQKVKVTDKFTIGDTTKSMHLYEIEATLSFMKTTGKIIGWIFYGYASS